MKKYILLLFFVALSTMSYSQMSVSYSAGYAMFNQGGLHDALKDRVELLKTNIGAASIDKDYSDAMIHTFALEYAMGREEYGFQISYIGTKSEINATDGINGYYIERSNLTALRFGTLFRYHFIEFPMGESRKFSLYGEISPGITVTSLKYKNVMTFIDEDGAVTRDDLGGSTVSISILPKVGIKTNLLKKLALHVAIGYDLSISGSIENLNDAPIKWSGVRSQAGLSYIF